MNNLDSHHAFLIKGNKAEAEAFYNECLQNENIEASFVFEKNLTIETARDIKEIATQTTSKSCRYIIASAYAVGHEAQNALLKTLEELPLTKKIIFYVESFDSLLPTFISRFAKGDSENYIKNKNNKEEKKVKTEFKISALLKRVEKICASVKDETETKTVASEFLDELIIFKKTEMNKVKKLLYFKSCIGKPSASIKQILESAVAITL
jgi:DNA polymerase III delta prime subunit